MPVMIRFALLAFGAGVIAVVGAMAILHAFATAPDSVAATLREDDLVCLMEAAWSAGAAAFSFWSTRTHRQWFVEARIRLTLASTTVTALSSFAALALLGFFVERRSDDALQNPSPRTLGLALLVASAIVAWQRWITPSQPNAERGPSSR